MVLIMQTADKAMKEIELFYSQLDTVLQTTKSRDITVMIGD